jgi:hypothetical protein
MSGKSNGTFTRQIAFTKAVAPSDSADLPGGVTRGLLVGADGDVAVVYANGLEDTLFLAAGIVHPIQVVRIKSTGTTATDIKAGY